MCKHLRYDRRQGDSYIRYPSNIRAFFKAVRTTYSTKSLHYCHSKWPRVGRVHLLRHFLHNLYLLASERSERDTYRGNTIENRGCLFIYLFIYLYICLDVRM